jgi:hypothetical protein
MTMASLTIEAVLQQYTEQWMALPGVIGTGQGICDDNACIKVFVAEMTPEVEKQIPGEIEGYRVKIEKTGTVHARQKT